MLEFMNIALLKHPSVTIETPVDNLAQLRKGDSAIIIGFADDDDALFMRTRLQELGFLPGEKIHVHAEAFPGRDPMAIRVGNSIFALRRSEAEKIRIVQASSDAE